MKPLAYATGAALLGAATMTGCANQPKNLYYWGNYQKQVHEYLIGADGGDSGKQIEALEAGAEEASASGHVLPPGYRAQLGMLYHAQGKPDLAVARLQQEKAAYPESGPYIDRLLAKFKKN